MPRKLPPLNAIRVFEAVARQCSFIRAAEELHVSTAAVSQQIKLLEDQLGVTLFKRGRTLMPSETSSEVLPMVSEAFDQLERAMTRLRSDGKAGPLFISAPPAFAARWLVPRMDDFHTRYPAVELRLNATRRPVDFSTEDVDAAIRLGTGDYPDLQVEFLKAEKIVLVAAPKIAASIPTPAHLAASNLLEDEWHVGNGAFPSWQDVLSSLGVDSRPLRIRRYSDVLLTLEAALAGSGVALAWHSLAESDIRSGRLVQLFDSAIATGRAYHLVMPKNRANQSKVDVFRTWLVDQLSDESP